MSKPSLLRRFFGAIWGGITRLRVAMANILFLLMFALIYFVYVGGTPKPFPERAALLLNPRGAIVDQKAQADPLQALVGEPSPRDHEVLLRDVIDAIEFAGDDPTINSIVMELDFLMSVGLSKTQEIVTALEAFKASGKPVVAVGDFFTQDQYLAVVEQSLAARGMKLDEAARLEALRFATQRGSSSGRIAVQFGSFWESLN